MPPRRAVSAVAPILVSHGDAFVAHDSTSDRWSIGSRDLDVSIGFDATGTFTLQSMTNPATGRTWNVTAAPDVSLTAGTKREVLGRSGGKGPVTLRSGDGGPGRDTGGNSA